jgi:hypothetical protein
MLIGLVLMFPFWCEYRNLATGLVAGCGSEDYENNSSFSLFTCSVYLTVRDRQNNFIIINN